MKLWLSHRICSTFFATKRGYPIDDSLALDVEIGNDRFREISKHPNG